MPESQARSDQDGANVHRSAAGDGPLLTFDGVCKQFGGTRAVDGVSLTVDKGEIVALLGENGAGKSTLIKILAGVVARDAGHVHFNADPSAIAFIHQDLGLIEWMTVSENICLSLGYPRFLGLVDWSRARARAARALEQLGADIDPEARVQSLSRTEKSLVAISRALAADAALIVLDEPTASLPADEVARLFACLRRLKSRGVAMIYVSHRLDEVFEIADRMVVLRDGKLVGTQQVAETTPEQVILMIVGREPAQVFRRPVEGHGRSRLVLENLRIGDVGPVNADIRAGEVVGLVGLRGAGQEIVGRALFGLAPPTAGRVLLDGAELVARSPREAMAAGIQLVWGDRMSGSIVPILSVRENMFLNPGAAGRGAFSFISPHVEAAAASRLGTRVGLRPNDPTLPVEALSGGNQQKVVVGRWLHLQGKVYVFEDPTAGVDVGAKADIYGLFNVSVLNGAAILIVSTDFEEIANVCHRALVFDRGQLVAEVAGAQLSVNALLAAASARIRPTRAAA
jgi:ribose transport system ATP-binding protein